MSRWCRRGPVCASPFSPGSTCDGDPRATAPEAFDRYRINMPNGDDVKLTRALERCEVPAAGFPHAFHLRVAWVYLAESASVDEAIARMASSLRRFAESVGKAEKYSQATTEFWMHQVAAVRAVMPGR